MRITKVMVNRKFNLSNYESLDLAAEAELSEKDSALEVWELIRDNIEMEFQAMQRKDRKAATPASDQAQQAQVNPFKKVEQKPASKPLGPENKCPNCGKWKDAKYPVCYNCHLDEGANSHD